MAELNWRTSSRSQKYTECVEVAVTPSTTYVRDSKDPSGGRVAVPAARWRSFLDAVRTGQVEL